MFSSWIASLVGRNQSRTQADLKISDTEFGLLSGLAFALFYAAMDLPMASLADRKSRPLIIVVGVTFSSLATVACGLAGNFAQLFVARMCVGAGEAALTPATYSLTSDLFPKDRLGRATAIYSLGSFLGAGTAFLRCCDPDRSAAAPPFAGVRGLHLLQFGDRPGVRQRADRLFERPCLRRPQGRGRFDGHRDVRRGPPVGPLPRRG